MHVISSSIITCRIINAEGRIERSRYCHLVALIENCDNVRPQISSRAKAAEGPAGLRSADSGVTGARALTIWQNRHSFSQVAGAHDLLK